VVVVYVVVVVVIGGVVSVVVVVLGLGRFRTVCVWAAHLALVSSRMVLAPWLRFATAVESTPFSPASLSSKFVSAL
jgi:hypothetical protein